MAKMPGEAEEEPVKTKESDKDLVRDLQAGRPCFVERLSDARPLLSGDHILYQASGEGYSLHYRSALVVEVQPQNSTVVLIGNTEKGVEKQLVEFSALAIVYLVHYSHCCYPRRDAIKRAEQRLSWGEKRYHALFNNSHFFVTWAKTGKEYNLDDIIEEARITSEGIGPAASLLKPVLTKVSVSSLGDVKPGDHLFLSEDEHLLIASVDPHNRKYTAFTTKGKGLEKKERKWKEDGRTFRIDYDRETKLFGAKESLQIAESLLQLGTPKKQSSASSGKQEDFEMYRGWASSDEFVVMMKTGQRFSLSEDCLFSECNVPVGCTPLIPTTGIVPTEADHIVVRNDRGLYQSVLVLKCITDSSILVKPSLDGKAECMELNLLPYKEVYRINYKECLPVSETLRRATSEVGTEILNTCTQAPDHFVSWAKTGKQKFADVFNLRERLQVAQIRPSLRQRLLSVREIQVGDHIIQSYPTHWFHCMVTECDVDPEDPRKFTAIYCLRTSICEEEVTLDPTDDDIYRIVYAESLPAHVAIKRARTLVNSHKLHPLARLWFVRWAKTGSNEGMEVELLTNASAPISKSRICSFAQLNPGDYLVEDESRTTPWHHYLVVEVSSPTECSIVKSWNKKITQRSITYQETSTYYRLNYVDGACIVPEQAISLAETVKDHVILRPSYSRRQFVNFLKTYDESEVSIDKLQDDRLLLRRERVTTAMQLLPGDHIMKMSLMKRSVCHHMIVYEKPQNGHECKVIHLNTTGKGRASVQVTEEDFFGPKDCAFQITYPERLDAQQGLQLTSTILAHGKDSFQSFESNCEYFVTNAIVGHPLHIQSEEGVEQAHLLPHNLYKLHRMRTFGTVSEVEYKRAVVRQSITSANMVVGGAAGVVLGQIAIPIPVVGAVIGGVFGTLAGSGSGSLQGWLASKLIDDDRLITLPMIVPFQFTDFESTVIHNNH